MQQTVQHRWDLPVPEAMELQTYLAQKVVYEVTFEPGEVHSIAGVDASYNQGWARAAVAVLSFPELNLVATATARVPVDFPYQPGLLAFREGPAALAAMEKLATLPDLLMFDAHGVSHPRRLGLAAHIGVLLDHPSIGCAKSQLVGYHCEPGHDVGDWESVTERGQVIGAALRTRAGAKPIYVSIGHKIDLATAIRFVVLSVRGRRLPETTCLAHGLAARYHHKRMLP